MGRAIAVLIDHELARVAEAAGDDSSVLTQQMSERLAKRETDLANREKAATVAEERLRTRTVQLRRWETVLRTLVRRVHSASRLPLQSDDPKVGRNDRCPCGSGLKYKYCHGLTGQPPNVVPR